MLNPFEKRATEYLRNDNDFLEVVTPEPLEAFFITYAQNDSLYDRLVMVIGTPGSGKTTIARLFQYPTINSLINRKNSDSFKSLVSSLVKCNAIGIEDDIFYPNFVGCRLPLESDYRDFWELPYTEELKNQLMFSLLQARAVLSWLRGIKSYHSTLDGVEIISRGGAGALLQQIGGTNANNVYEYAKKMEQSVYNIASSLLPPDLEAIPADALALKPYHPFDAIEFVRLANNRSLRPLVIFDDAHILHPNQLIFLKRKLVKRELKIARWILTRIDALTPEAVFSIDVNNELADTSGINMLREITQIWLQKHGDRTKSRGLFRKMARNMADRYLGKMEIFRNNNSTNFESLLSNSSEISISKSHLRDLKEKVDKLQKRYHINDQLRKNFEEEIHDYLMPYEEDVALATLKILFERYYRRTFSKQLTLWDENEAPDLKRPLTIKAALVEGARIYLLHQYGRSFYYGLDSICDGSSENAEQFLQLASIIVSHSEMQIIRRNDKELSRKTQNDLLRKKALGIIESWYFPFYKNVLNLANIIGLECKRKTLEDNAPLGSGASAVGILQKEFDELMTTDRLIVQLIKYGVAYNVFTLVRDYKAKNQIWCLLELGGVLLIHHGLTLNRGGFIERTFRDLENHMKCEEI